MWEVGDLGNVFCFGGNKICGFWKQKVSTVCVQRAIYFFFLSHGILCDRVTTVHGESNFRTGWETGEIS